jgi:type II secretory pathway pseudopilin PulG
MPPIHLRARRRQAGFTLIELTVSLIVIVEVLLAVLMLFDFSNKLSHAQSNIADMQQSLRIAQNEMNALVRTAGRGGLTFFNTAAGGALWVRNNVGTTARVGDASSPLIVPNTDVLTVRGVFSSPMYQVNYLDTTSLQYKDAGGTVTTDPNAAVTGTLRILAQTSPDGQTLQTLADIVTKMVASGKNEAMIIESANNPDVHAVVELLPPPATTVNVATQAVLAFQVRGTATVTSYQTLIPGGGFPSTMKSVSEVGILEEYRFYIRQNYASTTDLASKLTKARFMPGTDTAWGGDPNNLQLDLADNILDLQVALAADSTNHIARSTLPAGTLPAGVTDSCTSTTITADPVNCYISEATNGVNDDWVYNGAGDDLTNGVWTNAQLYYVRVSLLARTDGRDKTYEAPVLTNIEDHAYTATDPLNLANTASGSTQQRMFRRRILQTVIDVRNL